MAFTETNVGVSPVRQHLTLKLKESVGQLFGIHTDEIDDHASFLDMGADSLSLLRVSQVLQEKFHVKIPFRSLLEELSSIDEVAAHIERTSPPEIQPPASEPQKHLTAQPLDLSPLMPEVALRDHHPENGKAIVPEPVELTTDAGTLERILSQQMRVLQEQVQQQTRIMSLQLEMLQAARQQTETTPAPAPAAVKTNGNGHSKVAPVVTVETPTSERKHLSPITRSRRRSNAV
jgi:acyl carrier protein